MYDGECTNVKIIRTTATVAADTPVPAPFPPRRWSFACARSRNRFDLFSGLPLAAARDFISPLTTAVVGTRGERNRTRINPSPPPSLSR